VGRTLSLETGIRCGNQCGFCYQLAWREAGRLPDPDFNSLAGRMEWGREHGFEEIGLSGGEPTIRKDFIDLLRHARKMGYTRVSVTTNGRRFQNESFARQALEAGLDGIGWSLHGPEAALHDRLVGRDGAFEQVLRGLANVSRIAGELQRRVEQNLFTLVNRHNADRLPQIGRLALKHSIRLLVLQPVIYSKGNLASAASLSLPLSDLVAAIRDAARCAAREGWFVKPFNLPPCFLTDVAGGIEHQRYPVEIFRYQDSRAAGESHPAPGIGFVRLDRCAACLVERACPGLHQSLLPPDVLLRLHLDTLALPGNRTGSGHLDAAASGSGDGNRGAASLGSTAGRRIAADGTSAGAAVWTAGLELLDPPSLERFLARLRASARDGTVRVYHGGDSVAGPRFLPTLAAAGVAELCLLARLGEPGSSDLSVRVGNAEQVRSILSSPELAGSPMRPWLAVPYSRTGEEGLVRSLAQLAFPRKVGFELQVPADFKKPEVFELARFGRLGLQWARAGGRHMRVVVPDGARRGTPSFRIPLEAAGVSECAGDFMSTHWHCGPAGLWIASSLPSFLPAKPAGDTGLPPVSGLPGEPIDATILSTMRPG
jgi:MoaA/NifB/PqqE/SkfB family radical SAM enzyme